MLVVLVGFLLFGCVVFFFLKGRKTPLNVICLTVKHHPSPWLPSLTACAACCLWWCLETLTGDIPDLARWSWLAEHWWPTVYVVGDKGSSTGTLSLSRLELNLCIGVALPESSCFWGRTNPWRYLGPWKEEAGCISSLLLLRSVSPYWCSHSFKDNLMKCLLRD